VRTSRKRQIDGVQWSARAAKDLEAIGAYIAQDNPRVAFQFVEGLIARGDALAEAPLIGRMVPEFGRPDTREVISGNYRIVYRVIQGKVYVLTVFEGHRKLGALTDVE
jgi:toxin ParE1/3/4